jgi:hypothetical protein
MYSSTLSLTSALDGVGSQRHAPAALPPGNTWYPLYRRLGGLQGWSAKVYKNTRRFIMFFVITNMYNKKTKGPTVMELFTATEKVKKFF